MITTATPAPVRSRTTLVLSWVLFGLALAGVVVSAISLVNHYRIDPTEYCDINQYFNFDLVNRSIFASVAFSLNGPIEWRGKIPVAAFGVAGYGLLTILAPFTRRSRRVSLLVLLGAAAGMAFALRLTYIEARILVVWCIFCIMSQAIITLILALSIWQTIRVGRRAA